MKTSALGAICGISLFILLLSGCGTKAPQAKEPEPSTETSGVSRAENKEVRNETKTAGLNGFMGEIRGTPVVGSKFQSLQIGMTVKQVTDILGRPSWRGTYGTPFGGGDRTAFQLRYRNQGDLVFTGGKLFDSAPGNLVIINQNAKEYAFGSW